VGDWDAEAAAWTTTTSTCTRCGDALVRDPGLIGTWLSDREGRGRGLCPGTAEMHRAGEVTSG
jgi:hypothetical protein